MTRRVPFGYVLVALHRGRLVPEPRFLMWSALNTIHGPTLALSGSLGDLLYTHLLHRYAFLLTLSTSPLFSVSSIASCARYILQAPPSSSSLTQQFALRLAFPISTQVQVLKSVSTLPIARFLRSYLAPSSATSLLRR